MTSASASALAGFRFWWSRWRCGGICGPARPTVTSRSYLPSVVSRSRSITSPSTGNWPTRTSANQAVGAWIENRYNRQRRHSSIGQISPATFEMQHCNHTAADQQAAKPPVHHPGSGPPSRTRSAPGSRRPAHPRTVARTEGHR